MNTRASKLAPAALLATLALAACDKPAASTLTADARPRVLCSNPPIAWLVKQIAGDKVIVQTLAHAGGCGHEYQPTDAEMAEAGKAQVWFTAGLEFEKAEWGKKIPQHSLSKEPHSWLSYPNLITMAETISNSLHCPQPPFPAADLGDGNSLFFSLPDALHTRHTHLRNRLADLSGQTFLADHGAYAYFAADYGLNQLTIEEDEGHAPSDAHLTELIAKAKQAQVKVLFLAEEANRPLAETVAKAVGAKVVAADPNEENTPALLERMADELVKAHGQPPKP